MTPVDPAELGLDVTVGIAAITTPHRHIVAVSDQRISYDDWFPATEEGARKILRISDRFWLMFAATDVSHFTRVVGKIIGNLAEYRDRPEALHPETVMTKAAEAYSEVHGAEFAARHLTQLGYKSIEAFRKEGRNDLGPEIYADYIVQLAKFDLGVEVVIFGYAFGLAKLFLVTNPGRFTELNWQGYAALGSGATIAYASLRHKPMPHDLEGIIYRLLEAKFASETARDVGKTTTLITMNSDGIVGEMGTREIDEIRAIWTRTQKEAIPADALALIEKSRVVTGVDGER